MIPEIPPLDSATDRIIPFGVRKAIVGSGTKKITTEQSPSTEIVEENNDCILYTDGSMSVKDLRKHGSGKIGKILGITGAASCIADVILLAQGSANPASHEMGVVVGASGMLIGMGLIVYGQVKDTKKQASFNAHLMSLVREEETKLGRELTVGEKLQIGTTAFDM